jgi:hypothetical protein
MNYERVNKNENITAISFALPFTSILFPSQAAGLTVA